MGLARACCTEYNIFGTRQTETESLFATTKQTVMISRTGLAYKGGLFKKLHEVKIKS